MKKVMMAIALGLFSLGAVAQNDKQKQDTTGQKPIDTQSNTYCAKLVDGMMVIMKGDQPIMKELVLANGTKITPDGTVIKMDGTRIVLKEEECINENGDKVKGKK